MPTTFQDDVETVNVSKLRASGAITAEATSVVARPLAFGRCVGKARDPEARRVVAVKRRVALVIVI
jgi:hypothetical protein